MTIDWFMQTADCFLVETLKIFKNEHVKIDWY